MDRRDTALLLLVSVLRGGSYLPVVVAAAALAPGVIVLAQVAIAAAVLTVYAALRRPGDLRAALADLRARPGTALLAGALFVAVPLAAIAFALEAGVPTGLAAVLVATAPMATALLAPRLDARQRVTGRQAGGLGAGLAGVAVAVGPERLGGGAALAGVLLVLVAAASYAAAGLVAKRAYEGPPSALQVAITTMLAALPPLVAVGATGLGASRAPGPAELAALLVLGALCTGLALAAYLLLVGRAGAGRAVLVTYLSPVAALALGTVALDEPLGPRVLAGFALVLAGVVLATKAPPPPPDATVHPLGAAPRGGHADGGRLAA